MEKVLLNSLKEIFAKRLQSARKVCGLSQADLVNKMTKLAEEMPLIYKSVSTTAIERYENAVMYPENDAILATIAVALNTKISNLTRPFTVNIDCSKFEFRKRSKLGKKAQEAIKIKIQNRIEKYIEIERIMGLETKFDVDLSSIEVCTADDARAAANLIRVNWGLGNGPISQPINVLEAHGVKVIEIDEDPELFDGISNVVEGIPIVVLNGNDEPCKNNKHQNTPERRYLTGFHEFGHTVLNFSKDVDAKEKENLCNVFANEMLIPSSKFKEIFGEKRQNISSYEFKAVQREYGISVRALMMKAVQLGVIKKNRFSWYCVTLNKPENEQFRKMIDASAILPEHTSRFECLVHRALASEIITISKAADLLDISVSELRMNMNFDTANENNN